MAIRRTSSSPASENKALKFVAWCMEEYIEKNGLSGKDAATFFREKGITRFLYENYEMARLLTIEQLFDDIKKVASRN